MGCCTLKTVVGFGIFLSVLDMIHSLTTIGFYGYQLVMESFYLCPADMAYDKCYYKDYIYKQMFELRVFIGMGEGLAGILFTILYIVALVKRKPSLTWFWLLKSFGVIVINIFYLSSWMIRRGHYGSANLDTGEVEDEFIYVGSALTAFQIFIILFYCLIGGLFTYKVVEERTASRRNLRHRGKWDSNDASAPPLDNYDEEKAQFLNRAMTNSEKTLPVRTSQQSLTDINRADTFKHSTGKRPILPPTK